MILLRNKSRRAFKGIPYIFIPLLLIFTCNIAFAGKDKNYTPDCQKLLRDIHDEVLHFGVNEDPNLVKREFWMDLDGCEENKEEHVIVMRHNDGMNLRMTVQVTYFSEDPSRRFVRYAKETKLVQCCIKEDDLEIDKSDYTEKEMEKLFPDILTGIRNKKEILKLIKY